MRMSLSIGSRSFVPQKYACVLPRVDGGVLYLATDDMAPCVGLAISTPTLGILAHLDSDSCKRIPRRMTAKYSAELDKDIDDYVFASLEVMHAALGIDLETEMVKATIIVSDNPNYGLEQAIEIALVKVGYERENITLLKNRDGNCALDLRTAEVGFYEGEEIMAMKEGGLPYVGYTRDKLNLNHSVDVKCFCVREGLFVKVDLPRATTYTLATLAEARSGSEQFDREIYERIRPRSAAGSDSSSVAGGPSDGSRAAAASGVGSSAVVIGGSGDSSGHPPVWVAAAGMVPIQSSVVAAEAKGSDDVGTQPPHLSTLKR